MMFARNLPGWVTLSNSLRALALVALVPLGYAWGGVQGAVLAVVASQFAGWPLAIAFKLRQGLMSWQSEAVWPVTLLVSSSLGWLMHLLLDLFLH
jgi:hypothetical protein